MLVSIYEHSLYRVYAGSLIGPVTSTRALNYNDSEYCIDEDELEIECLECIVTSKVARSRDVTQTNLKSHPHCIF
jgi:hypothetical protein